ncbi:imidazole glycerol phosphate synthase subunit HisH [Hwanghaeella sp. LZ110]|jgi:imidazole glycerol-phosphate synthase subunit HisH|uniref:imidazole glycerol phosphate synthase subunit HisH n=1 Tax=Hwanghaeella sp. LZ110 TaxID=3402810 RepID=UPI003B6706BA
MITIVDYGRGNIFSISHALKHLDEPHQISSDPQVIASADSIILPGVGAFADAMSKLDSQGLPEALHEAVKKGAPLLGICLGMQLLATDSDEFGMHAGLDIIPGHVRRLPAGDETRIPNVGWRQMMPTDTAGDMPVDRMMYFVHSYGFEADMPKDVAATVMVNGVEIAVAVRRDNVVGCQFHPEKSGPDGLRLMAWFLKQ